MKGDKQSRVAGGFDVATATEEHLNNLVEARQAMRGMRWRIRCKRCQKDIPETRRNIALFCSTKCQRAFRWEERTALRTEIRATMRELTAPKACPCGEPLDNRPGKRGRVANKCRRCNWREQQRARRERQREANVASDEGTEDTILVE